MKTQQTDCGTTIEWMEQQDEDRLMAMPPKERAFAILNDTVHYYGADPKRRATVGRGCLWLTSDGRRCAIGRFLGTPEDMRGLGGCLDKENNMMGSADNLLRRNIDLLGLPPVYWAKIQLLHDTKTNWDIDGLTPKGHDIVDRIAAWVNQNL